MTDFATIDALRDRLAAATGAKPPADDKLGADLKAAALPAGHRALAGDPATELLTAIALCDAMGFERRVENDMVYVLGPHASETSEVSGFHVEDASEPQHALALCRGIVAELWLSHPGRAAHFEAQHAAPVEPPKRRSRRR